MTNNDVKNHAWVEEAFKVLDRPKDCIVTDYKKFIDIVRFHIAINL